MLFCVDNVHFSSILSYQSLTNLQYLTKNVESCYIFHIYIFPVAVCPCFPIDGMDFIMGIDIAGGKVYPTPEVTML